MNRKIRLIWDFYGETATGTAEHHIIHLDEFMLREDISYFHRGVESAGDLHAQAYMTVDEKDVKVLRDSLRPNRAFIEK